jgi:hypothetical protein
MKKSIQILAILLLTSLTALGQKIPVPENYSIVDTVTGDLDKDGRKELVVAFNTSKDDGVDGVPRELIIYKLENKGWTIWKKSRQALYGSRDGGMMGDPFGEIKIENGILLISQNGGSSWKWDYTDRYRYQEGEFYLIGYISNYGKPCEYWQEVDFNLSTGKMIVKKEYEDCEKSDQTIYKRENETLFKKGLKISITDRNVREIKIITPKYRHKIYIAVRKE